jgi:uncharacterized membrane protein
MEYLLKAGRIFFGIAIIGLAIQQFQYADIRLVFVPQWPAWIHSGIWAYLSGAFFFIAGTLIITGKKAKVASVITGSILLFLFIALQVPYLLFIQPNSPLHLGLWTDPLKEFALSGGAFVVASSFPKEYTDSPVSSFRMTLLEELIPFGKFFFAIMLIAFGLDHFYYTEFVSGLVPVWMPSKVFWTYFAGVALIGSGASIFLNSWIKHIALLSALMLFLWLILLHIPRAVFDPSGANGNEITSVLEALAFSGILLIIASLQDKKKIIHPKSAIQ